MLAPDAATKLPQWVENDRKVCWTYWGVGKHAGKRHGPFLDALGLCVQVLRFYGYFKESVVESNMENHRIRKVILYYYLEDDSMHVAEPRQDNSGIPQVRLTCFASLTNPLRWLGWCSACCILPVPLVGN